MIGHCGVVCCQRRSVSACGSSTTVPRPRYDVEPAVHDEHAAPDDLAGPADTLDRAAAEAEIDRWLALADGPRVAADEVRRRHRARDLEHPHVVVPYGVAPTDVVQRGRRRRAERVQTRFVTRASTAGALVDLVEARDGPTLVELGDGHRTEDRWPVRHVMAVLPDGLGRPRSACPGRSTAKTGRSPHPPGWDESVPARTVDRTNRVGRLTPCRATGLPRRHARAVVLGRPATPVGRVSRQVPAGDQHDLVDDPSPIVAAPRAPGQPLRSRIGRAISGLSTTNANIARSPQRPRNRWP